MSLLRRIDWWQVINIAMLVWLIGLLVLFGDTQHWLWRAIVGVLIAIYAGLTVYRYMHSEMMALLDLAERQNHLTSRLLDLLRERAVQNTQRGEPQ